MGFQTLQSIALAGGEAAPEAFLSAYHAMFRVVGIVAALTGGIVAWSAVAGRTRVEFAETFKPGRRGTSYFRSVCVWQA